MAGETRQAQRHRCAEVQRGGGGARHSRKGQARVLNATVRTAVEVQHERQRLKVIEVALGHAQRDMPMVQRACATRPLPLTELFCVEFVPQLHHLRQLAETTRGEEQREGPRERRVRRQL